MGPPFVGTFFGAGLKERQEDNHHSHHIVVFSVFPPFLGGERGIPKKTHTAVGDLS